MTRPAWLIPDLAPDQVCLAVAPSRTSPEVDDFLAAAQATTEITADAVSTHG
ncbi:hypothetical protein [Actinoplanes sp. NPDC051411]|uniref:hypothetical protein n=1 Tax=Actinoplanes sp. NPDC051411 TaxID=3155522 RepID=UPI00341C3CA5